MAKHKQKAKKRPVITPEIREQTLIEKINQIPVGSYLSVPGSIYSTNPRETYYRIANIVDACNEPASSKVFKIFVVERIGYRKDFKATCEKGIKAFSFCEIESYVKLRYDDSMERYITENHLISSGMPRVLIDNIPFENKYLSSGIANAPLIRLFKEEDVYPL